MRVKVVSYGHTYSQSMDQSGKVANLARGQLNRENEYFPVRVCAREFGLARRVRQSRPASASTHLCTQAESGVTTRSQVQDSGQKFKSFNTNTKNKLYFRVYVVRVLYLFEEIRVLVDLENGRAWYL